MRKVNKYVRNRNAFGGRYLFSYISYIHIDFDIHRYAWLSMCTCTLICVWSFVLLEHEFHID